MPRIETTRLLLRSFTENDLDRMAELMADNDFMRFSSSRMHTSKILRPSMDLPMIIEIVDSEEKIQNFLPILDKVITGGLITMEKVRAIQYRGAITDDAE